MKKPKDRFHPIPPCPVCGGELTLVHEDSKVKLSACRVCGTSVRIPNDAWVKARVQQGRI